MKILNRRARHDYFLLEKFEAGIVLTGPEVKSIKAGQMSLQESFVRLADDGAFLVNAHIPPYKFADSHGYKSQRTRRLLLHKSQILSLAKKMEGRNLTLVPVSCYSKRGKIKLEVALARGKKKWDKREALRRKDLEREVERELKIRD